MSDQQNQPKNLSEISHLFLSGIREKQTGNAPRPQRTPPPRTDVSIDLTPEEFAEVFGEQDSHSGPPIAPITAVIASHLGTQQLSRVRQYAASLAAPGKRIGLIVVDAAEFRLSIFEHGQSPTSPANETDILDARQMTEALQELAWDVDRWLLLLPGTRGTEARALLREVGHWTLLSTADHDGVVSCYRTLKGLSDLHRPRLSLATLDAIDDAAADSAHQRISSVCRQFLNWHLENETPVIPTENVSEHIVLWACATRDKAQLANAPQWQVVSDFLAKAKKSPVISQRAEIFPQSIRSEISETPAPKIAQQIHEPIAASSPIAPTPGDEVIDLPDPQASAAAIVHAVVHGNRDLVECPVKAPMCADASLAVSRDHRLVLIAVAEHGLSGLREIGRAYQWIIENRALIAMAVPQMSIDAMQLPRVQLLVDHADMSADILQPILHANSVTVHAYRKLKWSGKTGLLLEAA
jgi:hypothetical protein